MTFARVSMMVAAAAAVIFAVSVAALSRAGGDLARHGEFLQLHHFYYGIPLLLVARRRRWYYRAAVVAGLVLMVDDAGQHLAQWQTGDPLLRSPVHQLYARLVWRPLFGGLDLRRGRVAHLLEQPAERSPAERASVSGARVTRRARHTTADVAAAAARADLDVNRPP